MIEPVIRFGDCFSIMREIPDNSVDCIITDPPYGMTHNAWDYKIPLDELWIQFKRIRRKGTPIVIFSMQPFTSRLVQSNLNEFRHEIIYEKSNSVGFLNAKKRPLAAHENILVFSDCQGTYNPQMTIGKMRVKGGNRAGSTNYNSFKPCLKTNNIYYPRSVIRFNNGQRAQGMHPTAKPLDLMQYLVRTFSNPGETVLDPFMGGASTGIACQREQRNFIGIERDPHWFNYSIQRFQQEQAQTTIFEQLEESTLK